MVGSRNEPEQLLELLQAAAGELKTAQSNLEIEKGKRKELQAHVERLDALLATAKAEKLELQSRLRSVPVENTMNELRAHPVVTVPAGIHSVIEEKTGIAMVDQAVLEMRNRGLEEEVERAKTAEQQLREKLVDVEAEYAEAMSALSKLRNGLSTGEESVRVVKLVQQLNAVSKELTTTKEELAMAKAAAAMPSPLVPASSPSSPGVPESDAAKRVTQLEGELALVRSRRDDLNVELARVENDRKLARTRVAELEVEAHKAKDHFGALQQTALAAEVAKREALAQTHAQALAAEAAKRDAAAKAHAQALAAETTKRTEAEAEKLKERDRHQATAQKLIDGRTKIRELEGTVAQLTAKVAEVEAKLAAAAEVAKKALTEKENAWVATRATLEAKLGQTQTQLDTATSEWRHVERSHEQLHREMLTLLDQRDEARRELTALKARLGIA